MEIETKQKTIHNNVYIIHSSLIESNVNLICFFFSRKGYWNKIQLNGNHCTAGMELRKVRNVYHLSFIVIILLFYFFYIAVMLLVLNQSCDPSVADFVLSVGYFILLL